MSYMAVALREIDRLTAENAKLTGALRRIENVADEIANSENTSLMTEVLEYARAALPKPAPSEAEGETT